jgi:hypothetical protein
MLYYSISWGKFHEFPGSYPGNFQNVKIDFKGINKKGLGNKAKDILYIMF